MVCLILISSNTNVSAYVSPNQPSSSFRGGKLWSTGEPYVNMRDSRGNILGKLPCGGKYYFDKVESGKAYTWIGDTRVTVDVRYLSTKAVGSCK